VSTSTLSLELPPELASVDWYNPTPEQVAALAKYRAFIPDGVYPVVQEWMNSFTADFIVTQYNRGTKEFLLVRRGDTPWKGQFFVPGGRIRFPEVPLQACIRNVKRELGFEPLPETIRFVGFLPVLNPEGQTGSGPWFSTWCLHEVELPEGVEIQLDKHGQEFEWFNAIQPDFLAEVKKGLEMIGGFRSV
jgi:ADP-ribose pyrophosphatase YjhB (NUDIX family)